MAGITMTSKKVTKAISRLLEPGTILVGHALHHDLTALKIDHQPVIDTSLLFRYDGLPNCTPSLADLAATLLKLDMRSGKQRTHDMYEDAHVAMKLVLHELQHGPSTQLPAPQIKVPKEDLRKLLVHSIPVGVTLVSEGSKGAAMSTINTCVMAPYDDCIGQ